MFLTFMSPVLLWAQDCQVVSGEVNGFGSPDEPVTADIEKLTLNTKADSQASAQPEYRDQKGRKFQTFFKKMAWAPHKCWAGSTLESGVEAYFFPNLMLAKHMPKYYDERFQWFAKGIYAWYTAENDSFYLWAFWNSERTLGPFKGNPVAALKGAIVPRRPRWTIPGVTVTVVSQRWKYPDPEKARSPCDKYFYDNSRNSPSGAGIEYQKLITFFTRFRLTNNSANVIYYLENPSIPSLVGFTFFPEQRPPALYMRIGETGTVKWERLSPGDSVEGEVESRGESRLQDKIVEFMTFVNTNSSFWDEAEVSTTFPMMTRDRSVLSPKCSVPRNRVLPRASAPR
jgi:hypothetical protein